jgi:hypothetical protein
MQKNHNKIDNNKLLGQWKSHDDEDSILIFEKEGVFRDVYLSSGNISTGIWQIKDSQLYTFIEGEQVDSLFSILEITDKNLSLSYLARGNTLNYTKLDKNIFKSEFNKEETKKIINDIKTAYKETNDFDKYKKITMDIPAGGMGPTNGGKTVFYFKKNNLKKVSEFFDWGNGKTINEYYYNNNELFFAFEQNVRYEDSSEENHKIKESLENRYYFHKNSMVLWINEQNKKLELSMDTFNEFKVKELNLLAHGRDTKEMAIEYLSFTKK